MKSLLITEAGRIDENGRLWLPMERINQFCGDHRGMTVIAKFEAVEGHSSQAIFRYYFGYVLPSVRAGFAKHGTLMTERQTGEFLWGLYPGEHNPDQDIRQAPQSHVIGFLEWLKEYAAENLETFIEDPTLL